jgi:hypothetical protein
MDLRAVTPWSLLGANDWDSLLTKNSLHYESGAFTSDVGQLKMTAVGHVIKALALSGSFDHPLLAAPGWWSGEPGNPRAAQTLLLIGSEEDPRNKAVLAICSKRKIACQALYSVNRKILGNVVENGIDRYDAWGMLSVTAAEEEKEILGAISRDTKIPWEDLPVHSLFSEQQIDRAIDLFIDKAVAMAVINNNTFRLYAKEQVHVCHGY